MKTQTKKIFSLTLLGIFTTATFCIKADLPNKKKERPINVPSIVDGTPPGINGHQIRRLLYIIREVEKMIYGILDPIDKVRRGKYIFLNQSHSVSSLAQFERENTPIMSDSEFQQLLRVIIEEFITIATPFIEQGRGVKSITLTFMKEWSEKHDREDSGLLNWAREKDGQEFDSFRREVKSFDQLYVFCQDLISFISDLIQSCPRGWQQFLDLQQKNKK